MTKPKKMQVVEDTPPTTTRPPPLNGSEILARRGTWSIISLIIPSPRMRELEMNFSMAKYELST